MSTSEPNSSATPNADRAITELFEWLRTVCETVTDAKHNFSDAGAQVEYLCVRALPSLDHWYRDRFAPALDHYLTSVAKCAVTADHHRRLADLYGHKTLDGMLSKALHHIDLAIRYTPVTSHLSQSLSRHLVARSALHCRRLDLELALDDVNRALHYRPHSTTAVVAKAELLVQLGRQTDALRTLKQWIHTNGQSCDKLYRVVQMQQQLADDLAAEGDYCAQDADHTEEECDDKSDNSDLHEPSIEVDRRVRLVRDEHNGRMYLQATESIAPNQCLVTERPVVSVLKAAALNSWCSACHRRCAHSFVPCAHCTEAVFCNSRCKRWANHNGHHTECAISGVLQRLAHSKALQVYRLLTHTTAAQLVRLHLQHGHEAYSAEEYWTHVTTDHVTTDQLRHWFGRAQCDMRRVLSRRVALRSAHELATAIFVVCVYRYKQVPQCVHFGLNSDQHVATLVQVLATELAKVTLSEFSWHHEWAEDNECSEWSRVSVASGQCLVSSHVTHSCEPNTTWNYLDGRVVLRSSTSIAVGQPLTITYGSVEHKSVLHRLAHLYCFSVMCACDRCIDQVTRQVSLVFRCDHCADGRGPVPFHHKLLPGLLCMRCERPWAFRHKVHFVQSHLRTTERLLWAAQTTDPSHTDAHEEWSVEIGRRLDSLAGYMYPRTQHWLRLVNDYCALLMQHNRFDEAVQWFQWMVDRFDVWLSCATSQTDPMRHLRQLDQWTTAYVAHIVPLVHSIQANLGPLDECTLPKLVQTTDQLFVRLSRVFTPLNQVIHSVHTELVPDRSGLMRTLHSAAQHKWQQFCSIIDRTVIDHDDQLCVSLEPYSDHIEFEVCVPSE